MNIKTIITIAVTAFILLTGVSLFFTYMNVQGEYQRRNNSLQAAFDNQRVAHDEMWKVIKSKLNLKDELKQTTLQALEAYSKRGEAYSNASFVWVQESFPQLNQTGQADFYKQIAITIDSQNGKFTAVRNTIVFVTTEYNNFVTNPWNQFFLTSEQEQKKDSKIITSSTTDDAANTLQDDLKWMK